jgi:hypothetical protein
LELGIDKVVNVRISFAEALHNYYINNGNKIDGILKIVFIRDIIKYLS